jgi:hypothetical protein
VDLLGFPPLDVVLGQFYFVQGQRDRICRKQEMDRRTIRLDRLEMRLAACPNRRVGCRFYPAGIGSNTVSSPCRREPPLLLLALGSEPALHRRWKNLDMLPTIGNACQSADTLPQID